jgi:glutamate-1-semialdehyde aminotransferase
LVNFDNSIRLYEDALKVIPMGTSTFSRSPGLFPIGSVPLYIQSAQGSRVRDVDGNEFIDYSMALAVINLGYANPEVNAAAKRGIDEGLIYTLSCPEEAELARKIVDVIPCAEMVRFFKNGSDSCEGAVKLSRALTGKQKVVTVGGYHGFHDWYVASTPRNVGILPVLSEYVIAHAYNDLDAIRKTITERSGEIAALIMEPLVTVEPHPGFLQAIRELTAQHDVVLVFDEMKTGFRLSVGGAQEYFGVLPDIAVFGKGIANGFPISALAGSKRLMKGFENENCFMSGSYATEKASILAALKTIEILERGEAIPHIWRAGAALKDGIQQLVTKHGLGHAINVVGLAPMQHMVFSDAAGATAAAMRAYLQQECAKLGVLFAGYHHPSFAHTDADIAATLGAYNNTFAMLSDALKKNDLGSRLEGQMVTMTGVRR